jgi:Na+/phosphate symporter
VAVGLFCFVLALELLKKGARGIVPAMQTLDVNGMAGGLGFGWLMACVVLSGSPVAAIALALLASRTLTPEECFAMIVGSRLGASFVVLLVGALDDRRAGRVEKRSAYIGVTALVATALTYVPAMGVGWLSLRAGALRGLTLEGRDIESVVQSVYGPVTSFAARHLPGFLVFVLGVLVLLGAFRLFDTALPDLSTRRSRLARVGEVVYKPWFMFVLGLAVTAVTLSVSVSLSLLVPLAAKGYIRRENIAPYILGANITTFDDTLFAAALVGHPDAVRIVALLVLSVSVLSLPLVFLCPHVFERLVDRIARRATANTSALVVFVAGLLLIPVVLLLF